MSFLLCQRSHQSLSFLLKFYLSTHSHWQQSSQLSGCVQSQSCLDFASLFHQTVLCFWVSILSVYYHCISLQKLTGNSQVNCLVVFSLSHVLTLQVCFIRLFYASGCQFFLSTIIVFLYKSYISLFCDTVITLQDHTVTLFLNHLVKKMVQKVMTTCLSSLVLAILYHSLQCQLVYHCFNCQHSTLFYLCFSCLSFSLAYPVFVCLQLVQCLTFLFSTVT